MNRVTRWLRGENVSTNRYAPKMDIRASAGMQIIPSWQINRPEWIKQTLNAYDHQAYRINALVFDCVQTISEAAGSAPLKTRIEKEPGQFEWVGDNDLDNLLRRPNIGHGGSSFMSFIAMNMNVMTFSLIEKERDRAGRVIGLWCMRSDWARPIRRSDGTVDWEYRIPGKDARILKAIDSICIPYAETPDQRPTGIGPIEVAFKSVETITALTNFLKSFMDRGAMPLYFAEPNLEGQFAAQWSNPATVEAARKKFNAVYGGFDSDEGVILSPGIKSITPMGFDMNELAFPALRNINDADVCQAFGVPPILVNAQVGMEHSTYSNTAEARKQFYEGRMQYIWSRIDDAFSRSLLPDFFSDPGYDLAFDISDVVALQEDNDKKSARAVSWFDSGLVSSHVAQKEAGVEPHGPDHFKYPLMVQLVPVSTPSQRSWVREVPFRQLSSRAAFDGDAQVAAAILWFDAMFPEYKGILTAGEDGSKWTYDADSKTYVDSDGNKITQKELIDLRDQSADSLATQLGEQVERNFDEPINNTDEFIQFAIIALFLLGRGGRQRADANDASTIATIINEQTGYWYGFVTELSLGQLSVSAAIARAHLYGVAPVHGFDQGAAAAWGANRALPYYPGDAGTLCKSNCRCFWSFSQREDGSNAAVWSDRGDSRECSVCRGRGNTYTESSPFQLRGPDPSGKVYPVVNSIQG